MTTIRIGKNLGLELSLELPMDGRLDRKDNGVVSACQAVMRRI